MITEFSPRLWLPVMAALVIAMLCGPADQARAQESGQEIFEDTCAACHTIGKGVLVGPDLSGVTARRDPAWLLRQIKEPDQLIAEKDPLALQLVKEADDVEMTPPELSDAQIAAVIAYLKSTENQGAVSVGLPSQYVPTVIISIVLLLALTLIGLKAGSKKVDVR